MGKKNKNKNKQEKQAQNGETESKGVVMETQTEEVDGDQPPQEPEIVKTAEERADEYKLSALEIHNRFVNQFKEEEDQLNNEPDVDGGEEQLKKKEQEEIKKLEKMVKKENEQFEDLTSTGAANAKQVHDKIVRTLETSKRVKKEFCKV